MAKKKSAKKKSASGTTGLRKTVSSQGKRIKKLGTRIGKVEKEVKSASHVLESKAALRAAAGLPPGGKAKKAKKAKKARKSPKRKAATKRTTKRTTKRARKGSKKSRKNPTMDSMAGYEW